MTVYAPPLREFRFLLREVLQIDRYANLPGFADAPADLVDQIFEEAGKFCAGVIHPLNAIGDREGCVRSADGAVTTPRGYKRLRA